MAREARKRARFTQRELAERAGTTPSAIARLEPGATSPTFENVLRLLRLLRLCGLDLDVMLVERDDSDRMQAQRMLALTMTDRLERGVETLATGQSLRAAGGHRSVATDPGRIVATLADHGVEFVLIGGWAAIAHGSPLSTQGVDLTPAPATGNLARLETALAALGGAPVEVASLPAGGMRHLDTDHGVVRVARRPLAAEGYDDLARAAVAVDALGVTVLIASLADVIRSKQAANRPQDERVLPVLREILATRRDRD